MADTNLVPLKSIMVSRDGKRVSPPIGKGFPFTAKEVAALKEGTDYRKPVNEDEQADLASIMPERNSPHIGKGAKAPATGGGADNGGGDDGDERLKANAADVITAIGEITDKADLAALKAAEEAGKNRTTVVAAIDARVTALTTDDDL